MMYIEKYRPVYTLNLDHPAYKSRVWGCLHTLAKMSCFSWLFTSHAPNYMQCIMSSRVNTLNLDHPAYKSRVWGCLHTLTKMSCFSWLFTSHAPNYMQCIMSSRVNLEKNRTFISWEPMVPSSKIV